MRAFLVRDESLHINPILCGHNSRLDVESVATVLFDMISYHVRKSVGHPLETGAVFVFITKPDHHFLSLMINTMHLAYLRGALFSQGLVDTARVKPDVLYTQSVYGT